MTKPLTKETKDRIIRLMADEGESLKDVVDQLGESTETVIDWISDIEKSDKRKLIHKTEDYNHMIADYEKRNQKLRDEIAAVRRLEGEVGELLKDYLVALTNLYGILPIDKLVDIFNEQNDEAITIEHAGIVADWAEHELIKQHIHVREKEFFMMQQLTKSKICEGKRRINRIMFHQKKSSFVTWMSSILKKVRSTMRSLVIWNNRCSGRIKRRLWTWRWMCMTVSRWERICRSCSTK